MWKNLRVGDVACVDDSARTRGVIIVCEPPGSYVTLIFDKAIPHPETDNLRDLLRRMKLTDVIVETPWTASSPPTGAPGQ